MGDKKWDEAVVRAAAEASRLQPLALFLTVAALLLVVGQYFASPLASVLEEARAGGQGWRAYFSDLLEAAPALALICALWETHTYLGKLARGDVWGPATTTFLGHIGDWLLYAAILSALITPTLQMWVSDGFRGFDWRLEAQDLVLAGLGLLLSLIGRVVRNVVEVAAALKAENDEIV